MSDVSDWKSRLSRVIRSNARDVADRYEELEEEFERQGGFQGIGEKVKKGFEEFAGYVRKGYREATGDGPGFEPGFSESDPMGRDGTTESYGDGGSADRSQKRSTGAKSEDDKTLEDYYANLEVDYGADLDEVKQSYRRLMRRYHPDNFADDSEMEQLATELTQELSHAYEKIREHKRR